MDSKTTTKLAVLIDADNASASKAGTLLDEIAKYGTAFVKRAYGDWTEDRLKPWKKALLEMSIQPIQQFAYTQGKNSTDSAMIIDAMDLLYSNRFDGFCIVSSDSDFTRLASRIRESGLVVYGFGERKAPKPFQNACDKYIFLDNIISPELLNQKATDGAPQLAPALGRRPRISDEDWGFIKQCILDSPDDGEGYSNLAAIGHLISGRRSAFDVRDYGFEKLRPLLQSNPAIEIISRTPPGKPPISFARIKNHGGGVLI